MTSFIIIALDDCTSSPPMSPRGFVSRWSGELNGAMASLIERLAEQRALVLDDADDLVRNAADAQLAPDGVQVRKEVLRRPRRR